MSCYRLKNVELMVISATASKSLLDDNLLYNGYNGRINRIINSSWGLKRRVVEIDLGIFECEQGE